MVIIYGRCTVHVPDRYHPGGAPAHVCDAAPMSLIPPATQLEREQTTDGDCSDPVFILTASRSGSTLLRFILDSHPELACPPETGIASACASLARSWDLLDSANSGSRPANEEGTLPEDAAVAIRDAANRAFGSSLRRSGKRRWCDKSLDASDFADLLTQVYPEARFICLYRHCMDVIASGVEACPWGLHRFGFDLFAAQNPGNSVAAIASYWVATNQMITKFEASHPEKCHRVRYEDLVTAPEETTAAIFSFLGLAQAPGITRSCFQVGHDSHGPGDEKIWFTSGVTSGSLGRGVRVPAAAIPPPLMQAVNETLEQLDFRLIDEQWNAVTGEVDPRAHVPEGGRPAGRSPDDPGHEDVRLAVKALTARMRSCEDATRLGISDQWPTLASSTVVLIVEAANGGREELHVRFGPAGADQDIGLDGPGDPGVPDEPEPNAFLIAEPATWRSLLDTNSNLVSEICTGRLRSVNRRDGLSIRSDEVHAIATLLGLASIPLSRSPDEIATAADLNISA